MSKRIEVTKEVQFDCAHMLAGHNALCKNVHGHTYKVQVTVSAPELIPSGSSEGMVIDFKDLKAAINTMIVDQYDHAFVTWEDTPYPQEKAIAQTIIEQGCKVVRTCFRPTAENMAYYFLQGLQEFLNVNCSTAESECPFTVEEVKVWETPTSFASYGR